MTTNDPISDLYSRRILALAADIAHLGRLAHPDASARVVSRLCGSELTADLIVKDGVITDFAQEVKACVLGQAAAAIVGRHVIGSHTDEMRELARDMTAMLKDGAPPPKDAKWSDLALLEGVRDYKARHGSTLLIFNAITNCLDEIDARRAQ